MIIPIRCFTCNKPLAHLWDEYQQKIQMEYNNSEGDNLKKFRFVPQDKLKQKTNEGKVLDELGLNKYCCRRMFLCNVDLTDKI